MSAPRYVNCRCEHGHGEHAGDLAPQCHAKACQCLQYRPKTAPDRVAAPQTVASGASVTVSPIAPSAHPGPTIEQLIAAGKRSSSKRVAALAGKIEADLSALADRLREERAAAEAKRKCTEEQESARREIHRLEKQLADAKARLKTTRHELGLPGGERPTDGVNQCPDCPETFTTAQRLGVHRRWKHDYRKAG